VTTVSAKNGEPSLTLERGHKPHLSRRVVLLIKTALPQPPAQAPLALSLQPLELLQNPFVFAKIKLYPDTSTDWNFDSRTEIPPSALIGVYLRSSSPPSVSPFA